MEALLALPHLRDTAHTERLRAVCAQYAQRTRPAQPKPQPPKLRRTLAPASPTRLMELPAELLGRGAGRLLPSRLLPSSLLPSRLLPSRQRGAARRQRGAARRQRGAAR